MSQPHQEGKPPQKTSPTANLTVQPQTGGGDTYGEAQPIERRDTLQPGCYWRVVHPVSAENADWAGYTKKLTVGHIHLLLEVFAYEGDAHSVTLLAHPSDGTSKYRLMLADFLNALQPASDEEAQADRARWQQEIMDEVASIQTEMTQAQTNPLALPGVREAAERAVQDYEDNAAQEAMASTEKAEQREKDLRRIHRRAARRAEAKGNPLVVRRATVSDRLDVMISEGITADGVHELALEAGRRSAIAKATSDWLSTRARDISETLKRLTPFFEEQGAVAMAKAKGAITYVKTLQQGIASLNLYTGTGVSIVTVCEGQAASTSEPLALLQQKRFMDVELAVWAHVEDSFDWRSQATFFKHLAADRRLRDQVLPLPRCVVSMAVTARDVEYDSNMHWYDQLMNKLANQRVFLLVRNGDNIHAVYSAEPSHEAAQRLFPTHDDIKKPFDGLDGTSIGLQDLHLKRSVEQFEQMALHYKRFLILLCGLDHREKLFGEFYPPDAAMSFMSLGFQQRYMRFVHDDEDANLLENPGFEPVRDWIEKHNLSVRSGSRIIVPSGTTLTTMAAQLKRRSNLTVNHKAMPGALVASVSKGAHRIQIPVLDLDSGKKEFATAWLDGPSAKIPPGRKAPVWFLCVDRARLSEVSAHLHNRRQRFNDLSWLRTLRRVEEVLKAEEADEAPLRAYLRAAALEAGVQSEDTIEDALQDAIATWRCDHKGAALPELGDHTRVNQLLTLLYPKDRLADSVTPLLAELLAQRRAQGEGEPLRFVRTGKSRFALYTVAPASVRAPYGVSMDEGTVVEPCSLPYRGAFRWGWVQRHSVQAKANRLEITASTLVWLREGVEMTAEETLKEWPAITRWINKKEEAVALRQVLAMREDMRAVQAWEPILAHGRFKSGQGAGAAGEGPGLPQEVFEQICGAYFEHVKSKTYWQRLPLSLPIGMYQPSPDEPLVFLYAVASAAQVVCRYGNAAQRATFAKGLHKSQAGREEFSQPAQWVLTGRSRRLISMLEPDKGDGSYVKLPFTKTGSSHESGGVRRKERTSSFYGKATTRRERAQLGGDPRHQSARHTLSWNRAIDCLMGRGRLRRREFYKSLPERLRTISIFDAEQKRNAQVKAERKRRYEPRVLGGVLLVPMVWDTVQGRSIAQRVFGPPASIKSKASA